MITFTFRRRIGASLAVLAALGVAACSNGEATSTTSLAQTVTVVGLNTPESQVLTAIYSKALTNGGFRVAHRDDVADLAAGMAALKSGAADLFVTSTQSLLTYLASTEPAASSTSTTAAPTTTTGPTTTLGATSTTTADTTGNSTAGTTGGTGDTGSATSTTVIESTTTTISTAGQASAQSINLQSNQIGEILPKTLQIGAASNAEDKPVIACVSTALANISNLTDLSHVASGFRIAGPASFATGDPYGLVGFKKKFGASFKTFVTVAADKVADAMTAPKATVNTGASTTTLASTTTSIGDAPQLRKADCGAFNSLDPSLASTFTVLDDDKNWVPNNAFLPVLTVTGFTPGVSQMIDRVSQALTTSTLGAMIGEVTTAGLAPASVADSWLQSVGITS